MCGWGIADPVAEGLIPRHILRPFPGIHFDVAYSGSEHFFDFLRDATSEVKSLDFVAFRLPVLDVLQQFSEQIGRAILDFEPEHAIMDLLRSGNHSDVFLVDESGETLVERLYPETPAERRSAEFVGKSLVAFRPQNRHDLFRFLALNRERTRDIFVDYVSGKKFSMCERSKLFRALPQENHGYFFFHEELVTAMQKATGWPLERVLSLRKSALSGTFSEELAQEFVKSTDAESLDLLRFWVNKTFCRAHFVGMWPLIAATASCKLRDPIAWRSALQAWEQEHGLAWNDFGVVWREAKILTGF